jgi:hypothetical protein
MTAVIEWWMKFVAKMNDQGVPIPLARVNGKASVTGTLVIVSGLLCIFPVMIMVGTVMTRLTGVFTLNDSNQQQLMNAFSAAIQMHIAALGGYLGRGMQRGSDGKLSVDKSDKNE